MRRLLVAYCLAKLLVAQTAAVDVGKANFRLYCSPCHGIHAQGGRGPDLTHTKADLVGVITNGVPGTEMGAYAGRFDDEMIGRLAAYIRSTARVTATAVPGDPVRGRSIYERSGGCVGCHTEGGIGPSLARIGRQRSVEYLREKLLHPSDNVTPGYETLTITLKDGRTIRGLRKSLDDFSAQLVDLDRRFYSFRREEVAAIKEDPRSLMPDTKLTESERTDLLAFLTTLRGDSN